MAGTPTAEMPAAVPARSAPGSTKPVLDQRWPFPDGEVALVVTIGRPLSAADFASIGKVVAQIEQLVKGLASGEASA
jgi:hypothetical protein